MMKNLTLGLLLSAIGFSSCDVIDGSGIEVSNDHTVDVAAKAISVESVIELVLTDDIEPGKLVIVTDDNVQQYVVVKKTSSKVSLSMKPGSKFTDVDVKAYASLKQYNDVSVSGASEVELKGVAKFDDYKLNVSGASEFEGSLLLTNGLDITVSGASDVDISGGAKYCRAQVSGAGSLEDFNFVCDDLDANVTGASEIEMTVNKTIKGSVSGASSIYYRGNAVSSAKTSGGGEVKKM